MCRQVDDPEVLWSQAMREEELLPAVHTHLGALPLRLRDHVLSRYDYQPMPPMAYSALKGELWCFRYYLRKLCTPEHERHPLVDPVRFRNVRRAPAACMRACCSAGGTPRLSPAAATVSSALCARADVADVATRHACGGARAAA